jgi:phenylacetate-coenzyme A ligase PaaK-like adenylate-forming protein
MRRSIRHVARRAAYFAGNAVEPEYFRSLSECKVLDHALVGDVREHVQTTLHRYLTYCLRYSPFWHERWPAHARSFGPAEAESVLEELPILRKDDLRRYGHLLRIPAEQREPNDGFPSAPKQVMNRSGGSTGVPTEVWQDRRYNARNRAVIDHAYNAAGMVAGCPAFFLWGSNNELRDMRATLRKRASTWGRGLIRLPAFNLDPGTVQKYAAVMAARDEVDQAICFASALDTFLRIAEHEGIHLRRIRRAVTGGGALTPSLRDRVRRMWADEVFDMYGGRDVGILGMERRDHEGIAMFPWHNYLEVLADGRRVGEGETGEVHVTCVQNYSFALVRLSLGDLACWRSGSDAWNRPRLAGIAGRVAERLRTPDGGFVDPSAVIHLIGVLEARPWLRRFQVVQKSPGELQLRVETWDRVQPSQLSSYGAAIEIALGRLMRAAIVVQIQVVEAIEPAPSGKHIYCIGLPTQP